MRSARGGDAAQDEIAARLVDDLDRGFDELVLAYQQRLFAFAVRLTGSPADAEEIVQDAFVRAYRALGSYSECRVRDLAPRPWLYQITLNVARNRNRRRRLHVVALDGAAVREPVADARERPEAMVERADQGDELAALVATLPGRYRPAVILRHVEGLAYREIALILDQPAGTVRANVHRGICLLRQALMRNDVESAQHATKTGARDDDEAYYR